jgi:hypothetical protein
MTDFLFALVAKEIQNASAPHVRSEGRLNASYSRITEILVIAPFGFLAISGGDERSLWD